MSKEQGPKSDVMVGFEKFLNENSHWFTIVEVSEFFPDCGTPDNGYAFLAVKIQVNDMTSLVSSRQILGDYIFDKEIIQLNKYTLDLKSECYLFQVK